MMNENKPKLPVQLEKNWEYCGNLGEGAMGLVVKVKHRKKGTIGAAKLIHTALFEMPSAVKRFTREAHIAQKLTSPYIVGSLDVFPGNKKSPEPYIIFEFVDGGNLQDLLRKKKLLTDNALDLILNLAEGMSFAHQQGVIHRDFKPENILMVNDKHPKIADFGLASLNEQAEKLTVTGQMMGTPAYMAPEQLQGKKVNESADIYALALVAFELLSGRRPCEATDLPSIIQSRLTCNPPRLRSFAPAVLPPIANVIDKCLSIKIEDRCQSAEELIVEIKAARKSSSIMARSSIEATLPPALAQARKDKLTKSALKKQKRQERLTKICSLH